MNRSGHLIRVDINKEDVTACLERTKRVRSPILREDWQRSLGYENPCLHYTVDGESEKELLRIGIHTGTIKWVTDIYGESDLVFSEVT